MGELGAGVQFVRGDACVLPSPCEVVKGCSIRCCSAEASSRKSGCAASLNRALRRWALRGGISLPQTLLPFCLRVEPL